MNIDLMTQRKKQSVLLLEKSSLMFDAIRSFLVHAGFNTIIHCNSFDDAAVQLKQHKISLIITDTQEGSSTATDFLHFVRITKKQALIPFIVISGESQVNSVNEVFSYGYAEYLVKPFNEQIFHEKLEVALGNKQHLHSNTDDQPFQSKLIVLCEDQVFENLSDVSEHNMILCHSFDETISKINDDNQIDIVILDESFAKSNPAAMKKFLSLKVLGQVDIIIMLDNMSQSHIKNIQSLGIHYLIEKQHAAVYLKQLIPLLIDKKRNLTYTNKMVNSLREKKSDDSNLHDSVFHQIIDSSTQISENSAQITHNPKTPPLVSELANNSKYNAECINFWASAAESTSDGKQKSFKETIYIDKTLERANYLFKDLINSRHLKIISNQTPRDVISGNPILFNSLFMFLMQALLREVVYQSKCTVDVYQKDNKSFIAISGQMQHSPKLKSVVANIKQSKNPHCNTRQDLQSQLIEIQWSEPILRLIHGCEVDVSVKYNVQKEMAYIVIEG